jgi:hypothetical protein
MKKLLLTGISALFLATGTATAQSPKVELPDAMLGSWCGQYPYHFEDEREAEHWWSRDFEVAEDDYDYCANRGGIRVRKDGWDYARFGPQGSCKFVSVQLLKDEVTQANRPGDVYRVHADCKDGAETWSEAYDVQTITIPPMDVGPPSPGIVVKKFDSCFVWDADCAKPWPWLIRWKLPAEG